MSIASSNVLRTKADPDHASGYSTQKWKHANQSQHEWQLERSGTSKHVPDHSVLYRDLHLLGGSRWKFAPALDQFKIRLTNTSSSELRNKNVGGRHRILNGQINPNAAHRRHRMCGIPDT